MYESKIVISGINNAWNKVLVRVLDDILVIIVNIEDQYW